MPCVRSEQFCRIASSPVLLSAARGVRRGLSVSPTLTYGDACVDFLGNQG